jgi:hypothetical protein
MTAILGIIQFLIITYVLLLEFKHKTSATFLWATLFLMFGVMHLLASFSGDYEYSRTVLSEASLFVIMFCSVYLFVRQLLGRRVMRINRELFIYENLESNYLKENPNVYLLFTIFLIISAAKIIPILTYSGGILNTSWGGGRGYSTSLDYANSQQIVRIGFYALSGIVICCAMKKKWKLVTIALIISLFEVVITRNRIEILPIVCSLVSIYLYKNKRISIKVVIAGIFASILVIYVVYGLRVFRHYGTLGAFIDQFSFSDFNSRVNRYIETDNGELGLRKSFYYFVQNGNQFPGFGKMHTYIRMIFVYIPTRWSLGLKPSDFAITMGAALGNAAGVSTHPTLFGDCYANLGIFGFLLGLFWGFYCNFTDWIISKQKSTTSMILVYTLNAVVFTIVGRGSVYNAFWFAAYGVPLIMIFTYLKQHARLKFTVGKKRHTTVIQEENYYLKDRIIK